MHLPLRCFYLDCYLIYSYFACISIACNLWRLFNSAFTVLPEGLDLPECLELTEKEVPSLSCHLTCHNIGSLKCAGGYACVCRVCL